MSYVGEAPGEDTSLGRGTRRRKFAGYLRAANELRQSYQSTATRGFDDGENGDDDTTGIPGAFPDLKVTRHGNEEMIIYPSYARKHVKKHKEKLHQPHPSGLGGDDLRTHGGSGDADYWQKEWEIYEDENAVTDVDVRGFIYSPQRGAMSRKNRLMMSIARRLSGVPAPDPNSQPSSRASSRPRDRTQLQDEELAREEAAQILEKGEQEADVAVRGGYSETPDTVSAASSRNASPRPGRLRRPITDTSLEDEQIPLGISKAASWPQPSEMSPEELAVANYNLSSRLKPFMVNPAIGMSLTVFFYNENTSQSRTTRTNEAGHFNLRAALNFVPTHARVLAGENLSVTQEVIVTESRGVSLISDIDDTIKHSAIGSGAREIFRNAFIREVGDLTIEGVKEWYSKLADRGVKLHYVSNSPWQMYPILVSFFAKAELPAGSFHLKHYSGMLQGIFEPVAERKRGTVDRLLNDFPERRFILVGDSGEADLELYTETALMNPGRILGIFIRDVTSPSNKGFFDSSFGPLSGEKAPEKLQNGHGNGYQSSAQAIASSKARPPLPPRPVTEILLTEPDPIEEDLIDFSEDLDPRPAIRSATASPELHRTRTNSGPPKPSKPLALRGRSTEAQATLSSFDPNNQSTVAWKPAPPSTPKPHLSPDPVFREKLEKQKPNEAVTSPPRPQRPGLDLRVDQRPPPVPERKPISLQARAFDGGATAIKSTLASAYNAMPSVPPRLTRVYSHQPKTTTSAAGEAPSSPTKKNQSPLAQFLSTTDTNGAPTPKAATTTSSKPPPLPPPRKTFTAASYSAASKLWNGTVTGTGNTTDSNDNNNINNGDPPGTPAFGPVGGSLAPASNASTTSSGTAATGGADSHATTTTTTTAAAAAAAAPLNKREELWKRRWARARATLDGKGVLLRVWRTGSEDVIRDAIRLVEKAEKDGWMPVGHDHNKHGEKEKV